VRVFLDENIPRALRHVLEGHEVASVEQRGWKGKTNGELLGLVVAAFDVLITSDGNMVQQQNMVGRHLSVIVVPTNNLTVLRANALAIRTTLDDLTSLGGHVLIVIDWRGRRTLRRLDVNDPHTVAMPSIGSFRIR
jgi:predicted nuclease of predicted toxin-antitoxin system